MSDKSSLVGMHKLLARQIRRYISPDGVLPESLVPFLSAVEEAYRHADTDRQMTEHSMEVVSREMTERMEHVRAARGERDAVREALSLLEAAIEGGDHAVLIVDLAGHVVRQSSNFLALWPDAAEAIARRDSGGVWASISSLLDDAAGFEAARRVTESDSGRRDLLLRLRDGRRVELLAHPQRIEDRTVGWVWRFRDVTERHLLEAEIRHAQKMDAVGQIAGGIAHDFNNLLTTIRGNLSLLNGDRSESDRREHLAEIERASERAAELTRQLLAYGRRQSFELTSFGLDIAMGELEPMLRRILPDTIALTLDTTPGMVSADRGQLDQVVINLVLNARAAMPAGGTVTIATREMALLAPERDRNGESIPAGRYCELSVTDTGVGMSAATLERVFEPFFSTRAFGSGSGLGLSMVHGIVRQSRGFIRIESATGEGTCVRIMLPLAEAVGAATQHSAAEGKARTKGCTILLAEDEPSVRRFLITQLSRQGYAVLAAENGRVGVELAAQFEGPIDLVVSDVLMPVLGGPGMMRELQKVRPEVPVLFISAYTGDRALDDDIRAIAHSSFLPKPFSQKQLTEAIARVLNGDAVSTP